MPSTAINPATTAASERGTLPYARTHFLHAAVMFDRCERQSDQPDNDHEHPDTKWPKQKTATLRPLGVQELVDRETKRDQGRRAGSRPRHECTLMSEPGAIDRQFRG